MSSGRKPPIDIQTLRETREDGFYYVDKTAYAGRLAGEGKHRFLSCPRRFRQGPTAPRYSAPIGGSPP